MVEITYVLIILGIIVGAILLFLLPSVGIGLIVGYLFKRGKDISNKQKEQIVSHIHTAFPFLDRISASVDPLTMYVKIHALPSMPAATVQELLIEQRSGSRQNLPSYTIIHTTLFIPNIAQFEDFEVSIMHRSLFDRLFPTENIKMEDKTLDKKLHITGRPLGLVKRFLQHNITFLSYASQQKGLSFFNLQKRGQRVECTIRLKRFKADRIITGLNMIRVLTETN